MKVFVAGHNGMVGSAVRRTAPKDYEVFTASRSELDLTDIDAVRKYLEINNVDSIILAAAKVGGIAANMTFQKDFIYQNLQIQNSVIMAGADCRVPNLVFLGSSCIYPRDTNQPIRESALLSGPLEKTNEGYALAKIVGIRLIQAIYEELGLNYFSLMPTNLYGPNDNFDLWSSHVPAALIRKFHEATQQKSEQVSVWGSGLPRREFMHVDDMAMACWHMLTKQAGGELINVGTGQDLEIREFAKLLAEVVGYRGELAFDTSKPDGTPRKLLNVDKIRGYGWHHEIDLESGLKQTYSWFLRALAEGTVRGY
jgi:GDP-L-fucose synthase